MAARLALIGKPISHSLSPPMYNGFFKSRGINAVYHAFEVDRGGAVNAIRSLAARGYVGANVTAPLKREAVEAADHLDEAASETGAVNTVKFRGGEVLAFNTDWRGVEGPLREVAGARSLDSALVIGAGGAGAAAVYAMARAVPTRRVYIASRGGESARRLAERASRRWGLDAVALKPGEADYLASRVELIVNATPVGWGDGSSPLRSSSFREGCIVFDMVYRPLFTKLLLDAAKSGCQVVDGLWMLVYQAAENLSIWMGVAASPLELRSYAAAALRGGQH